MIFLKNAPCSFELDLTFYANHLMDTLGFLKLREFLVRSTWRKVLRLTIICPKVCLSTQLINFHQVFSLMSFYFCNFTFCLVRSFFYFAWIMKVTYNFEELREMTLSPPFELELSSLNVRSRTPNVCNRTLSIDYGSFMDGLLWSCCPKVISLSKGLEFQEKYIMVWFLLQYFRLSLSD